MTKTPSPILATRLETQRHNSLGSVVVLSNGVEAKLRSISQTCINAGSLCEGGCGSVADKVAAHLGQAQVMLCCIYRICCRLTMCCCPEIVLIQCALIHIVCCCKDLHLLYGSAGRFRAHNNASRGSHALGWFCEAHCLPWPYHPVLRKLWHSCSLIKQHDVLFLAWLPYSEGCLAEDGTFQPPRDGTLTSAAHGVPSQPLFDPPQSMLSMLSKEIEQLLVALQKEHLLERHVHHCVALFMVCSTFHLLLQQ